jgi:hypothetical protein
MSYVGIDGGSYVQSFGNSWTGTQTFGDGKLILAGSSSGNLTLKAPAAASSYVATLPAATTTLAGLAMAQTFTKPQAGTITTDNDGSFDQTVTNNFKCTPTGAAALTFTNHTSGQSGLVLFINGSNYAITAAATTYIATADLSKLSTTGTYIISYLDDGTNAYCTVSAALTSAGA